MIAPTLRSIWLMLAGVPLLLFIAVAAPGLWAVSGGWVMGVLALMFTDLVLAGRAPARG